MKKYAQGTQKVAQNCSSAETVSTTMVVNKQMVPRCHVPTNKPNYHQKAQTGQCKNIEGK